MRKLETPPKMIPEPGKASVDNLSLRLYRAYKDDILIEKATWYHLALPTPDACSLDVRQQATNLHDLFESALKRQLVAIPVYSGRHELLLDSSRSLEYARARREQAMRALATSRAYRALDSFGRTQHIASGREGVAVDAATLSDGGYRLQVASDYADAFFGEPLNLDELAGPDSNESFDPRTEGQWYTDDEQSFVVQRTLYNPGEKFDSGNPNVDPWQYQTIFPYMVRDLGQLSVVNG